MVEKLNKEITRRDLLKKAGKGGIIIGGAAIGVGSLPKAAQSWGTLDAYFTAHQKETMESIADTAVPPTVEVDKWKPGAVDAGAWELIKDPFYKVSRFMIPKYADVVIIGSGFGGSIAALRFAQSGKEVVVLEMGEGWSTDDFERTQDPGYISRLYRDYPSNYLIQPSPIVITQGMSVGGTSLVYCGILERIPDDVWKNYLCSKWPDDYSPEKLSRYYEIVEEKLNVHEPGFIPPRAKVMDKVCEKMGLGDINLRKGP